jgi:ParB-like chromosome segregation protein Spo0J
MTTAPQANGLAALAERIELWPIEKLRPYERNPRTHSEAQVDQIAASMVEFGWTNPVLVDEQGGILAGHGRLLAARRLGLAEVPVIQVEHLSEAQKRAYLIADNQLALQAGWSEELLAEELAWLRDESFDLDLIGFDASELERLLALADGEAPRTRPRTRFRSRRRTRSASRATSGSWATIACCAATPRCWPTSSGCSPGSSPT